MSIEDLMGEKPKNPKKSVIQPDRRREAPLPEGSDQNAVMREKYENAALAAGQVPEILEETAAQRDARMYQERARQAKEAELARTKDSAWRKTAYSDESVGIEVLARPIVEGAGDADGRGLLVVIRDMVTNTSTVMTLPGGSFSRNSEGDPGILRFFHRDRAAF